MEGYSKGNLVQFSGPKYEALEDAKQLIGPGVLALWVRLATVRSWLSRVEFREHVLAFRVHYLVKNHILQLQLETYSTILLKYLIPGPFEN